MFGSSLFDLTHESDYDGGRTASIKPFRLTPTSSVGELVACFTHILMFMMSHNVGVSLKKLMTVLTILVTVLHGATFWNMAKMVTRTVLGFMVVW